MSETTPNLEMPYILPSQAQKHVTHNEALQRLDALTQLVIVATLSQPPADPNPGACYEVAADPAGPWFGKAGTIALWDDGAWTFLTPRPGWRATLAQDHRLHIHDGTRFRPYDALSGLERLGVNATADEVNRLAVSGDATLLSHAGHGHQLKINKATPADVASLLFQSGWSGRAEMGLSGADTFALKTSADGALWQEALRVDAAGRVHLPQRPIARATTAAGTSTPVEGSESGFSSLPLSQGGFALGAPVAGGGQSLVVPATGLYFVTLKAEIQPTGTFSLALQSGTQTLATLREFSGASARHAGTVSALAALTAGDALRLVYAGSATVTYGSDRTEVLIAML
ncbi:hypothetical protein ASG25_16745 [Rhizobium sp. Leaf384]|uniref:DUF2793 domain-containing protein n=1 Tax=unclassified Rhizobium TaxID=2613769 RepID=UPI00071332B6|nr:MULTISPECIES: DUF2793 domain-containing protein [unclassified Rhizobium]KQR69257.1 hypothetical protein ASG03_08710 [Rhizobium sp. Leaf341]KQS77033.1 hypothetical protein ASG25_16745 [Rhizobium sp. Leaf384]KQS78304.1 hypothetical protein ASG58_07960 [Rhizobium sp. Leaf383]